MSRIIKMLTCCAFVVAFAAVGVSTASATFTLTTTKCTEGTGVATLCDATVEKGTELFELSGEEEVKVKAETTGVFKVASLGLTLKSTALKGIGVKAIQSSPLVKAYELTGKLLFESVTVAEPATCKLPGSTIETTALKGVPNSKSTEVTLEPSTGSTGSFASITLEGAECPATLVGTNNVKGTQKCSVPESAVDLKVHLLACTTAGSTLKFAGSTATFEGTAEGELASGIPWSGQEA